MEQRSEVLEIFEAAAENLKAEGEWFYKRTTFFYGMLAIAIAAQGYLFTKIIEKDPIHHKTIVALIVFLSVVGCALTVFMASGVANSIFWQDVKLRAIARIERTLIKDRNQALFFSELVGADGELDSDDMTAFEKHVGPKSQYPFLRYCLRTDIMKTYYFASLCSIVIFVFTAMFALSTLFTL